MCYCMRAERACSKSMLKGFKQENDKILCVNVSLDFDLLSHTELNIGCFFVWYHEQNASVIYSFSPFLVR